METNEPRKYPRSPEKKGHAQLLENKESYSEACHIILPAAIRVAKGVLQKRNTTPRAYLDPFVSTRKFGNFILGHVDETVMIQCFVVMHVNESNTTQHPRKLVVYAWSY